MPSQLATVSRTLVLWGACFLAMSVSHVWWDLLVHPLGPPALPHGALLIGYHELLDFAGAVAHAQFLRHLLRQLQRQRGDGGRPAPPTSPALTLLLDVAVPVMCIGVGVHTTANSLHSLINPGNEHGAVPATRLNRALYVWDEQLGHQVWFAGLLLAWGIIATHTRPKASIDPLAALAAASRSERGHPDGTRRRRRRGSRGRGRHGSRGQLDQDQQRQQEQEQEQEQDQQQQLSSPSPGSNGGDGGDGSSGGGGGGRGRVVLRRSRSDGNTAQRDQRVGSGRSVLTGGGGANSCRSDGSGAKVTTATDSGASSPRQQSTRPTHHQQQRHHNQRHHHMLAWYDVAAVVTVGAGHGVWMFMAAVEGQCVPLFTAFVVAVLGTWACRGTRCAWPWAWRADPVRAYWAVAIAVFAGLLVAYGAWQGWPPPEFRVLGLGGFSRWPGHFWRSVRGAVAGVVAK